MKIALKKYRWVFVGLLMMILFIGIFSFKLDFSYVSADSIKNYNVKYNSVEKVIDISSKKVCNITETIKVTYTEPNINIGLSRNISRINKITRDVNGKKYVTKTVNKLKLLSVTMNDQPEYNFVETDSNYYYINTGADGDFKHGQYTYKINYLYDMGEDFIDDFDDFTFDVMDYGFTNTVANFSCQVTLPTDFYLNVQELDNDLYFRTNEMKYVSKNDIGFSVNGNTIKFGCKNLSARNGLTMQLILPNRYFDTSYSPNIFYYFVLAFTILCFLTIITLLFLSRKSKKVIIIPEFYPPEGYSPLDVARSYRGSINSKDFTSLIIYWASKKYLSINIQKKNVILTKLSDAPIKNLKNEKNEAKINEYNVFQAIFARSYIYDAKKEKNKYNKNLNLALKEIYKEEKSKRNKLILFKTAIHVLSFIPFIMFFIWGACSQIYDATLLIILLFPSVSIMIFIYFAMPMLFKITWCAFFGGVPMTILFINAIVVYDTFYLSIITLIILLIGNFSVLAVRFFTEKDIEKRGQVLGFKKFLMTCELDKLNMLIEENPEYYYDILPFCYVFGITKKMQRKFKALNIPEPGYCKGISAAHFCSGLNHSISSFGGSLGGGSGGGGGGGSSGGGGGGGGCGGR